MRHFDALGAAIQRSGTLSGWSKMGGTSTIRPQCPVSDRSALKKSHASQRRSSAHCRKHPANQRRRTKWPDKNNLSLSNPKRLLRDRSRAPRHLNPSTTKITRRSKAKPVRAATAIEAHVRHPLRGGAFAPQLRPHFHVADQGLVISPRVANPRALIGRYSLKLLTLPAARR